MVRFCRRELFLVFYGNDYLNNYSSILTTRFLKLDESVARIGLIFTFLDNYDNCFFDGDEDGGVFDQEVLYVSFFLRGVSIFFFELLFFYILQSSRVVLCLNNERDRREFFFRLHAIYLNYGREVSVLQFLTRSFRNGLKDRLLTLLLKMALTFSTLCAFRCRLVNRGETSILIFLLSRRRRLRLRTILLTPFSRFTLRIRLLMDRLVGICRFYRSTLLRRFRTNVVAAIRVGNAGRHFRDVSSRVTIVEEAISVEWGGLVSSRLLNRLIRHVALRRLTSNVNRRSLPLTEGILVRGVARCDVRCNVARGLRTLIIRELTLKVTIRSALIRRHRLMVASII